MRIVVLRGPGLGDLLTAVPALRALRRWRPESSISLACPAALHELVAHWGLADAALAVEPLGPLPAAAGAPDLAVNLYDRGPESTLRLLELGPARLIAFRHDAVPDTRGLPDWRDGEHEVERWCRLLRKCHVRADPRKLDLSVPAQTTAISPGDVVLHPGASAAARRWPADRWAEVARDLREQGLRVVLTGSTAEQRLCLDVAHAAGIPWLDVVAGRTPPLELAALVGRSRLVLCGDTGIAQLAIALRTPSLVLYGPVSPAERGPRDGAGIHRVLWAGRTGDPDADAPDPGLLEITVDDVRHALRELHETIAA